MQALRNQSRWLALVLVLLGSATTVWTQTTAFSYQGRLTDGGVAANGSFDLRFALYDVLAGGAQQGPLVTLEDVVVSNGVFTVSLDFGAVFPGAARWLEISVRPSASVGAFTLLSPRQAVQSTPYAIRSLTAGSADGLSVACVNCITNSQIASVNGSAVSGAIPVASVPAGSGNYVQNTTTQQTTSNFNISGDGMAGGTLAGNLVNATTQYNLGGQRVLSVAGTNNTFGGVNAGAANTTGGNHTFFGRSAGATNTIGNGNSFFGVQAGQFTLDGSFNSFFGLIAGRNNTSGSSNSFFGSNNGVNNTTGSFNTFVGDSTGFANSTASYNAFFGYQAGNANTASGNAFFGALAGAANTSGQANSFFGREAGAANMSGSNNTLIGVGAEVGAGTLSNATALGALSQVDCSNCLVLGAVAGVNNAATSPNVGIGTTVPATKLEVVNNGSAAAHVFTTSYGAVNNAIIGRQAGGSLAAPSATASNLALLFLGGRGHTGAGFATVSRVGIGLEASEDWTATANGTRITFDTTANGTTSRLERMRIDQNGRVGIGTTSPVARLHVYGPSPNVSGVIRAETDTTDVLSSHFAIVGLITTNVPGSAVYGGKAGGVGAGVEGAHSGSNGTGVYGHSGSGGVGVSGVSFNGGGVGVRGAATGMGGLAGSFEGNVEVTGTLSKGGGAFKIDHPLDPANKYLYHSFVESPDMKNIYDGNVTTDALGLAEVVLPDWFEALNRDFRYQLTVLGQFAQAIVAEKIKGNRFKIRTSLPNVEVSWQVTGIRQDAFAERHRIPVEQVKPERERGSYLHPADFDQAEEKGVEWALRPEMMREMKEQRAPAKQSAPPAKSGHEKP